MPSIINSTTTSPGGLISTGASDNVLNIQTGDTTAITVSSSQVVTLAQPLPVASGGTGVTSNAAAPFALKGANTDITSLGNLTTALSISPGGTGSTTATAAFNALNPMTTAGDMLYESSPTVATRLPIGTTGQILTVSGGIPTWATPAGGGVTSLNGQTGAITNTDYGAIGSYLACLSRSGVSKSVGSYVAPGTSVAASELFRVSNSAYGSGFVIQESDGSFRNSQAADTSEYTSLSLSGTWRVLTYTRNYTNISGTSAVPVLVVRIS